MQSLVALNCSCPLSGDRTSSARVCCLSLLFFIAIQFKCFLSSLSQLLAGGDSSLLVALDLDRDARCYNYLTMGGEASTCTEEDKELYSEVRRAMGVSWVVLIHNQLHS